MSDIVKDYLERAIYDLRFEQKNLLKEMDRRQEALNYEQEHMDKAEFRLNTMVHDAGEIMAAARNLGITLDTNLSENGKK